MVYENIWHMDSMTYPAYAHALNTWFIIIIGDLKQRILNERLSDGVRLRCPNQECQNTWTYRGNSKFYASCTYCRTSVHVIRDRVNVESKNISNLAPNFPVKDQITSNLVGVETP